MKRFVVMQSLIFIVSWAAFGLAHGLVFDSRLSHMQWCASSPFIPDYQSARGHVPAPPSSPGRTPAKKSEPPIVGPGLSHEDWHGPHACAGGVYCVYSNPSFANGRGIVLVTTPGHAEEISVLPALGNASTDQDGSSGIFSIVEVPGKGLGIVATRPIRRGQRIMVYPPAIIAHGGVVGDLDVEEQGRLFEVGVGNLPADTRETFMAQMGHSGGHKILDITNTNSFLLKNAIGYGGYFGNFPEVSMYNHDCRPKYVPRP